MRKDFQGLRPAKEVIAEIDVYTSLCKRLQYVLSVNRIHTRVFLSVNQIQTTSLTGVVLRRQPHVDSYVEYLPKAFFVRVNN